MLTTVAAVIPLFAEVVVGERIVLAHAAPFVIGALAVRPATRTVARGGVETVIEPRVMQVLVALAEAQGAVLSRDELVERCWDGRIVGDDAINRVLARLRALAQDIGGDVFRIETITRVGYRLVPLGDAAAEPAVAAGQGAPARPDRRTVLALGIGGTALGATIGGGLWWAHRDPLPPAARAAIRRGRDAIRASMPDQDAAAVAAFREATVLAPDAAEPWGQLALAYRQQLGGSGSKNAAVAAQTVARVRDAAHHALAIDPDNADAQVALATMGVLFGHWLERERACEKLLRRFPAHGELNRYYATILINVGRVRDALSPVRRAVAINGDWPQIHVGLVNTYWHTNRLDEADRAMDRAFATWPRHYSVWFERERLLAYTGRAAQALAMFEDRDNRPIGIPEDNFAIAELEARALETRAPADIDKAAKGMIQWAARGTGFAVNAIFFLVAVGRLDDAWRVIDAYYFGRGFTVGPRRYSPEQGMYAPQRDRGTYCLLVPGTAALRGDARFPALMRQFGLDEYWRASHSRPDFGG